MQKVLWWFRTEEGHLRQTFSCWSRSRSKSSRRARGPWGPVESLLLQLHSLLQGPVTLHLEETNICTFRLGLLMVTVKTGMSDLLQKLNSLSLLLLPQSLSPLSLLEALTERVVVIVVDLQGEGAEQQTNS